VITLQTCPLTAGKQISDEDLSVWGQSGVESKWICERESSITHSLIKCIMSSFKVYNSTLYQIHTPRFIHKISSFGVSSIIYILKTHNDSEASSTSFFRQRTTEPCWSLRMRYSLSLGDVSEIGSASVFRQGSTWPSRLLRMCHWATFRKPVLLPSAARKHPTYWSLYIELFSVTEYRRNTPFVKICAWEQIASMDSKRKAATEKLKPTRLKMWCLKLITN